MRSNSGELRNVYDLKLISMCIPVSCIYDQGKYGQIRMEPSKAALCSLMTCFGFA